jgi:hypothetical protein
MQNQFWNVVKDSKHIRIWIASSRPIEDKIGSDLIMWFQETDYSHVLIIINDMVFQASHGFVNATSMENFLKENLIVNKIEIEKEKCDFKYLFLTLGNKYGYNQLIKIATKYILLTKLKILKRFKAKDNGNKFLICSEYVGRFLMLDWVNDFTDPEDIITYLETIKRKR